MVERSMFNLVATEQLTQILEIEKYKRTNRE
jgi:hypothetical protein